MAVLTAILISFVLLGLGAFVTDVGLWYAESAQLQNGADAAALAVAQTCAAGNCDTSLAADHPAGRYADANANDNLTTVDYICGNGPGLSTCPSRTTCPTGTGDYVDVHTLTLEKNGSHLLPPIMGEFLLGSRTYNGQTISACAEASWLPVGGGRGLAITISLCAWNAATLNGSLSEFAPQPPYPIWPPPLVPAYPYVPNVYVPPAPGLPGGEQVLMYHGSGNDCAGSPDSGWQLPGGFGYLPDTGSPANCTITVSVNNTYADQPGDSVSSECVDALVDSRTNHTVVYIPVYDGTQGTGSGGIYHLAGFAAFVVTGGWLNGNSGGFKVPSNISGKNYCSGSQRCLYGFFTQGLVPDGAQGGSNSLPGVYAVRLSG